MAFGFYTRGIGKLGPRRQKSLAARRRRSADAIELLEDRVLLSTYYVSTSGSDGNGGTSAGSAWATLQKAANTVLAGDTVHVAAGTYRGFNLTSTHSGTASSRISFLADPGATINQRNATTADGINLEGADYVTIDGFTLVGTPDPAATRAGIRVVGSDPNNTALYNKGAIITNNVARNWGVWGIFTSHADNVDIENNQCSGSAQQHGIYVSNASVSPIIRHNISYSNAACGIHMNGDLSSGGTGLITGAIVENNTLYNNGGGSAFSTGGGSAINCDGVQSSVIQNNLLYNNHASGISLYAIDAAAGAINDRVINNTIIMASDAKSALNIQNASTGTTIFNNILYDNNPANTRGSINISTDSLPGMVSDWNFVDPRFLTDVLTMNLASWRTNTGQDTHSTSLTSVQMQALFGNYSGNDFSLAAGSAAIDKGVSTFNSKSAPAYDIINMSRPQGPQWDVGAYEYDAPPTDISLSQAAIAENQPAGSIVGTFATTDPDVGNTFTYSLVSGTGSNDNASFTVSGNQLLTAASFNFEAKNSYSIRVRTTDQGGLWFEKAFTISVTDVDEIAPTVTAVYVKGSAWNTSFLSFLAGNLSGSSSTYGFAIPVGTGDTQLQTLPWRNLNQISIAFSENVSISQAQFAIVGSVGSYSVSGFSYNATDHVATWSLSAVIGADKLYVALPGSGATPVTDVAGNALDGEWTNPTSYSQVGATSTFPSGNGVAGGDFAFRLDVLPGDSTGGSLGKVNVADINQTKSRSSLPETASSYRSDFDGNGLVNVADINYVKSRSSISSLPVNPPVLPMFSTVSISESLLTRRRYSLY